MPVHHRSKIFISYSHRDSDTCEEVRSALRERGLGDRLQDDTQIRESEKWDPRIQGMMEQASVVVLVLSNNYFQRRGPERDYLLEKELPYLIEHYKTEEIDLLLLYWNPSTHFAPNNPERHKPFTYMWEGEERSYDLTQIQAFTADGGRVSRADEHTKLDTLQRLATRADSCLEKRTTPSDPGPAGSSDTRGERRLTVDLSIAEGSLHRSYQVEGVPVSIGLPTIPRAQINDIKANAAACPSDPKERIRLGSALYGLLFGPENQGGFARLAHTAWELPENAEANSVSVAVQIRCEAMVSDPWPLTLPWNLTAFRGENLAAHCAWSFELVPPQTHCRAGQHLSSQPPLLMLFDERTDGASGHALRLGQFVDQTLGYGAEVQTCTKISQLAKHLETVPQAEVLYVYGPASLELEQLATALGDGVALVVLNLVGGAAPTPPATLVSNRKVVCCTHTDNEAEKAQEAGNHWLQAFCEKAGREACQRVALAAFGPRVRLWSGCASLEIPLARVNRRLFRRSLIKLLLDRVTARRDVSDRVATALQQRTGVLGLVAAGTATDHPELLPKQVWHHYEQVRESRGTDTIHRLPLASGPIADAQELEYLFAKALQVSVDAWEDALDARLGETQPGEHIILSLEWQLPPCQADEELEAWLGAWLDLATKALARYEREGVLIVNILVVVTGDAAAAKTWCEHATSLYRERRKTLSGGGRRFVHIKLDPLSDVPVDDIDEFLDVHYRLPECHENLDPYSVAEQVHEKTNGVFAEAVAEMERLHDSGFQAAYAALQKTTN